ncbi:MAG TPA: site-2 protease family protein [Candidatus Melainabacteria bacterium]|nr:site-2 protease family protein [Candidatus Melainabacteria bacterium]HIN65168.1 site-2 protease family protein [Candidatus Obscuribacterales bacterium]
MQLEQNTIVSAIVVVGWIISLCFHEYGHGLAAYIGGDSSIKEKGYLSFNPFVYTNVGLSIVLPAVMVMFGGVGLPGAAVMVNNANLRGRHWESIVSFAGPLFSLIFTAGLIAFILSNPPIPVEWLAGCSYLAVLEIVVIIFNFLPVPGLDGFGILEPFLPQSVQDKCLNFQKYGILVLLAILWTVPFANQLLWNSAYVTAFALGLDPHVVMLGQSSFRNGAMPLSIAVILLVIVVHLIRKKTNAEREEAAFEREVVREDGEAKSGPPQS